MSPPPRGALEALGRVTQALEGAGYRYMLVGGFATFAWGEPRATRDFDLAVLVDEDVGQVGAKLREVLATTGVVPQGPFSTDFGARFVLPFASVPFDVFAAPASQAPEFARRRRVPLQGLQLWVQSPEDLVVSKLRNATTYGDADRADLRDAAGVVFRQWQHFDFARAEAAARAAGLGSAFDVLVGEVREGRRKQGLSE